VRSTNVARTSKSPTRVLQVAYRIARRTLPAYSHPCSPKKYTQHQLFACLVLKEFFRLDYRGVEMLLAESDSLRAVIDLRHTPDFTTLQKACRRLLRVPVCNRLLDETVRLAKGTPLLRCPVAVAAIDSSGFEAHRASNYFVRRRAPYGKATGKWQNITYRRFPKMALVCNCASHLILSTVPLRGPKPDFDHWIPAMGHARQRVRMTLLLADAGYDAEWIHLASRLAFETRTLIPPKHGRPTKKLPQQYYRRRMARTFQHQRRRKPYGQRSQVESVFSAVKRRLGSSVNAYSYWSQCRALMLKALTHNIMLLRRRQVFDRARVIRFDAMAACAI
jgi:Transposase DDE domain